LKLACKRYARRLLAALAILSFGVAGAADKERIDWWREARFGMFIHWGLYSQAAGEWNGRKTDKLGEWIMHDLEIPIAQYTNLVPQFNPVKFNAREWVRTAKDAGMRYIVITSKHHDGFGMFRSGLTDWCIKATPFQRDPLKELAAACDYYQQHKGRMITLEYILIAGVNDGLDQVAPLAQLADRLNAKVNLIPYNKVEGLPWERPTEEAQDAFLHALEERGVTATLRREKGGDIDAACGQLRLKTERELAEASGG